MRIPFFRSTIGPDEIEAVCEVLRSGWLTTGARSRQFEEDFVSYLGGDVHAVAVNSATAGLHLAMEACGIGPGDAVLAPTLTFTATAEVARYLGAEVVLVDVEPGTHLIDLESAERNLTPACKAIVVVHFGGLACDMTAILDFARRRGLRVIEDAAHALPASRGGRLVGTSGSDACVFSFYANKTITTGEGGMLVTRDPALAARARVMRTHGIDRDAFDRFTRTGAAWAYDIVAPGFKYNLTDIAAAIGVVQLARANELRRQREQAAMAYIEALAELPLDLPAHAPPGDLHAWHIFPVRVREDARATRGGVIEALHAAGIGYSVHYRPLHRMTYWRERCAFPSGAFPVADRYFEGAVTLPLFPGMREDEVRRVCEVVGGALQ